MSKLPSMPLFPADFFADTAHISGEAAAVYLVLLGHAWLRDATLPNDDRVLMRLARVSRQRWHSIKGEIMPFWDLGPDGLLRQKRQFKDHQSVTQGREANSKNGIKGNEKRWRQKRLNFNGSDIANAIAPAIAPGQFRDRNQNQNHIKDSFNGEIRQESRWIPTKRIGSRLFKAGELAPAYEGQPPSSWKKLKPEDCQ